MGPGEVVMPGVIGSQGSDSSTMPGEVVMPGVIGSQDSDSSTMPGEVVMPGVIVGQDSESNTIPGETVMPGVIAGHGPLWWDERPLWEIKESLLAQRFSHSDVDLPDSSRVSDDETLPVSTTVSPVTGAAGYNASEPAGTDASLLPTGKKPSVRETPSDDLDTLSNSDMSLNSGGQDHGVCPLPQDQRENPLSDEESRRLGDLEYARDMMNTQADHWTKTHNDHPDKYMKLVQVEKEIRDLTRKLNQTRPCIV